MTLERFVQAPDISHAWVKALRLVRSQPGRRATHLVVRIEKPSDEIEKVRALLNELLNELGLDRVETVRNTIFPAEWAAQLPEPAELAHRYRELLPTIARFQSQFRGTYFGRLVAFPRGEEPVDQLSDLVDKLRHARAQPRRVTSRYELNIYNEEHDHRKLMGFPCMSFCSFHLGDGCLHLSAHYRSHYLIERAYGNYLGLAELLAYVAEATDFPPGELLVVSGHAAIDNVGLRRLDRLLEACDQAIPMAG